MSGNKVVDMAAYKAALDKTPPTYIMVPPLISNQDSDEFSQFLTELFSDDLTEIPCVDTAYTALADAGSVLLAASAAFTQSGDHVKAELVEDLIDVIGTLILARPPS